MALEWRDIDYKRRQLTVERAEWRGHVIDPRAAKRVGYR